MTHEHALLTNGGFSFRKCSPEQIALRDRIKALSATDPEGVMHVLAGSVSELILDSVPFLMGARRSKARPTKSWLLTGRNSSGDFKQLGFDHSLSLILPDGTRAILGQPYNLSDLQMDEIQELRDEGLRVTVSPVSPHYPLWTISVIIQPPRQPALNTCQPACTA